MIFDSTLKIIGITSTDWEALSLEQKIKCIKKKLVGIHPDRNPKQYNECQELLEFYRFLREEDNSYLHMYQPKEELTRVSSTSFPPLRVETAQEFFADFKETIKQKFNNDFDLAFKSIFQCEAPPRRNANPEFLETSNGYTIYRMARYYREQANKHLVLPFNKVVNETNFDNALAFIYDILRHKDPVNYVSPMDILPPSFFENRALALKILAFFPEMIRLARFRGFPYFWQDVSFWLEAIEQNSKVFIYLSNSDKILTNQLSQVFNDKAFMQKQIARLPQAVHFLGDALKNDVDLLSRAIDSLSYSKHHIQDISRLLSQEMRAIDGPLATRVLNSVDLGLVSMFENNNPSVYFKYVHRACFVDDLYGVRRRLFIESLPQQEQAYANQLSSLYNSIKWYQSKLNERIQSKSYFFFPYQLVRFGKAVEKLKNFLTNPVDFNEMNQFLPDLYDSSLKAEINAWLSLQSINPDLSLVRFEPNHLKRLSIFFTSPRTYQGLLVISGVALSLSLLYLGLTSNLFSIGIGIALCLIALEKIQMDNDDRPSTLDYF